MAFVCFHIDIELFVHYCSRFFCCPIRFFVVVQCPIAEEVHDFEEAVRNGNIVWHRGPFNLQPVRANLFLLFDLSLLSVFTNALLETFRQMFSLCSRKDLLPVYTQEIGDNWIQVTWIILTERVQ